jgi:hypothetical protein
MVIDGAAVVVAVDGAAVVPVVADAAVVVVVVDSAAVVLLVGAAVVVDSGSVVVVSLLVLVYRSVVSACIVFGDVTDDIGDVLDTINVDVVLLSSHFFPIYPSKQNNLLPFSTTYVYTQKTCNGKF